MQGARYELYFGPLRLGSVVQTDSDFPNLSGQITYDAAIGQSGSPEVTRLARFVALNRESNRLTNQPSEQAALDAALQTYADYIESEDWRLIDEQGREHPILCPVLCWDDYIVWRWNDPPSQEPP